MTEFNKQFDAVIRKNVVDKLIYHNLTVSDSKYNCYYHNSNKGISFKIGETLRQHLIFSVFSEKEYVELYNAGNFVDFDKMFSNIRRTRIPERNGPSNGIYSETLLDMMLMINDNRIKKACIRTLHRQRSDNNEIKGFDSAHLLFEDDEIILMLGQAKLGGRSYCVNSIKQDIEKTKFLYTYEELAFIADKRGSVDPAVQEILFKMNTMFISVEEESDELKKEIVINFFKENKIRIVIPCLLAYVEESVYTENFEENYIKEIESIKEAVGEFQSNLEIDNSVEFLVFPISSVIELRKGMNMDE